MHSLSYKKDKKVLTFEAENNEMYTIGSKMFPLSKKKNIGLWYHENTQEIKRDERLVMLLDNISNYEFQVGKCYKNAEVVYRIGKQFDLNIKFYSGWLFPQQRLPIHHSWNVLNNRILIDTSFTSSYLNANKRLIEIISNTKEDYSKEEVRKMYLDFYEEEYKKGEERISQVCTWGKVPQGYVYFGTEDTHNEAIDRFQEMFEKYDNHPSYPHHRNENGESPLQLQLKERGIW